MVQEQQALELGARADDDHQAQAQAVGAAAQVAAARADALHPESAARTPTQAVGAAAEHEAEDALVGASTSQMR